VSAYTVNDGNSGGNYTVTTHDHSGTITKAPLTVTALPKTASRQYSDSNPAFTFMVSGFVSPDTWTTAPTCAAYTSSSYATLVTPLNSPAGSYPIHCSGGNAGANYNISYIDGTLSVTQEDASLQYSGDTMGQTGANMTLQAMVWDSAAAGYPGAPTGPTPDTTIGDITKIWVEFDIYNATNCGSGTPAATKYAQVSDTGTPGDGIGTATSVYTSASEASYCVISRLVAGSTGGTNQYYQAPEGLSSVITFYNNTGQFVTGGGWIFDPAGGGNGHGNFGFNARYNKSGQPQGQFVYVWRGTYNGVGADFILKSNALSALGFTQTTTSSNGYPMTATLQGKGNIQVNRASDGSPLASEGGDTFIATVTDSGLPSSNSGDALQLTLNGSTLTSKSFSSLPLQGGNVVIHMK
jgi:hypothetical protein